MTSTASCEFRAASVSSTRKMNVPLVCRANSQLNSAVRAPPMCSDPVGLGAKRTRTGRVEAVVTRDLPGEKNTARSTLAHALRAGDCGFWRGLVAHHQRLPAQPVGAGDE